MRPADFIRYAFYSLATHRLRTGLSALGIAVGIAAVILLTSIGQGLQQFVVNEFAQFGTHIISVTPGRLQTHGASLGSINSSRPLALDDVLALRRAPGVESVNPMIQGNADVTHAARTRRVTLYGVGHQFPQVFRSSVALGQFFADDDPRTARAQVVLGAKAAHELFANQNPLGAAIRIGGERYRVIGVMAAKGQMLGMDLDDTVFIPAGRALEMFNLDSLMEIQLTYPPHRPLDEVTESIRRALVARHGREDFTLTPQQKMLETFVAILDTLTFAIAAIGGVSLLVGGVGILTILTIAVSERTNEIGLLRAIGATRQRIRMIFLAEAALLASLGGIAGLALGAGVAGLIQVLIPALPVHTPWHYALAAELMAVGVGLAAGVIPAHRAALLDPLAALRSE